jgi:hypothetical protein
MKLDDQISQEVETFVTDCLSCAHRKLFRAAYPIRTPMTAPSNT